MSAHKRVKPRKAKPAAVINSDPKWTPHTRLSDLRGFADDLGAATDALLFFLSRDNRPIGDIAVALGRITNVKKYLELELRIADRNAGGAS